MIILFFVDTIPIEREKTPLLQSKGSGYMKTDIKPELINTKLLPPYSLTDLLERPRLIGLFALTARQKATILTAPAGYGKTVTMVQFAATTKKPLVWYQLDHYDNDPAIFLQYIIAGLEKHFPNFGRDILPLVAQGGVVPQLRLILTVFINTLEQKAQDGLTLVLDDYHQINEPSIHNFLQEVMQNIPGGVHIVIASREPIPFSLSRSIMLGEVHIVGAEELRFDREEIHDFLLRQNMQLAEDSIKAIEHKTAGWPIVLRMIGENAAGIPIALEKHGIRKIYDYLAAEVLDRQSEIVRAFLLGTSVLEELIPAFCDELFEQTGSEQILDYLEKHQLFLIRLGNKKTYRYHQLFREFLLERLGAKRQFWQREAGIIARTRGDLRAAVEYFGVAGAQRELRDILKEAGQQAFSEGRWQTVARWLEAVAEEDLAADPWLSLYRAKIEVYRGRLGEAEKWLNGLAPLFRDNGDQAGLKESWLVQARLLRCRGHFAESLELLDEILRLLPVEESLARFDLPLEKALCLLVVGRPGEAETVLTTALESAKRNNNIYVMTHLMEGLERIYYILGNYPKALQIYRQGAEMLPERVLPSYCAQDSIAAIYQDWGELERAFDYAKRNVAIKENLGLTGSLPSSCVQLAGILVDRNEWELAEEYYERAVRLTRENNGERFFLALSLVFWARCLSLQGRWIEARAKAEEALAEAEPQAGLVLAVCREVVSTILLQTGSVQAGKDMLTAAISDLERIGFKKALCYAYTFQAWLYCSEGALAAAKEYVQKSLTLAAKLNCRQIFLTYHEMLQPVLKAGLESGLEVTFVQRILVCAGERALALLAGLSSHANPEVRMRIIAPLAEIGGPRAGATICRLREDTDAGVRQLARLTARRLGLADLGKDDAETGTVPLQIATLGQFRIRGIKSTDWRTVKARDLLAYLVHQGEPVSKEKILEDLWPDIDQKRAEHIFRTTLYYLRQILKRINSPAMVHYESQQCQLRPGSFSSDRQRFQELAAAGLREGIVSQEAVALLEQAVELYRGEYMDGMDYPWLLPYKENLKYLCLEAHKQLARRYMEAEDYVRAITHLTRVEEYDYFTEEAHVMLMTAFARQGNYSAIRRQYRKMELIWKQELGLSLPPAIQDVYRSICKTKLM